MPRDQYMHPTAQPLQWVSASQAKRMLYALAERYDDVECHDRAAYIRRDWRSLAARPTVWRSHLQQVAQFEAIDTT